MTEWSAQLRAELPKTVLPNITRTSVQFDWFEGGITGVTKTWSEQYESPVGSKAAMDAVQAELSDHLCASEVHQKVMKLGLSVQVYVGSPAARAFANGTPNHVFSRFELTPAACTARGLPK